MYLMEEYTEILKIKLHEFNLNLSISIANLGSWLMEG